MGFIEVEENLTQALRLCMDVIDELFLVAAQNVPEEELSSLPCIGKIETITGLVRSISSPGTEA